MLQYHLIHIILLFFNMVKNLKNYHFLLIFNLIYPSLFQFHTTLHLYPDYSFFQIFLQLFKRLNFQGCLKFLKQKNAQYLQNFVHLLLHQIVAFSLLIHTLKQYHLVYFIILTTNRKL
jgi:hypothetical protein